MLSRELVVLSIVSLAGVVRASPPHERSFDPHARSYHPTFHRRDYVTPAQANAAYDYVIAGGGLAGLVLAARLSDDTSRTVLVLEAGPSGDDVAPQINTPGETYYNSLLGAEPYDWLYQSTPQANAGGRTMRQPRGKLLGGSAAINGMYMVRPSEEEVQAWHDLIAPTDASAASAWNWDSFFTALKDAETFSPPTSDAQNTAGMKYVTESHGSSGKLHVTYPG
ncbi:hypothetical protein NLJ89_g2752 [Agrocybe chaxingu]|uniref:Glucose-methanol-choline oxidoreductase N-terminal domain-containing protein n=1 Tax=Agrocybe chaxingu TaxID=84603 RepID=A0A9W8MYR8_9AGAR|nr:hypothetical protein NLJ89_g2752 [Agrocybe chaxingu]